MKATRSETTHFQWKMLDLLREVAAANADREKWQAKAAVLVRGGGAMPLVGYPEVCVYKTDPDCNDGIELLVVLRLDGQEWHIDPDAIVAVRIDTEDPADQPF